MMFFYSNVPKLKRISVAHAAPEIISVCRLNFMFKPLYVFHANNCCLSFFQPDLTFKILHFTFCCFIPTQWLPEAWSLCRRPPG